MKTYNIDRAKERYDEWNAVKDAKRKLVQDCLLIVKHPQGDAMVHLNASQAIVVLDDKEDDLKKRLVAIGVEVVD